MEHDHEARSARQHFSSTQRSGKLGTGAPVPWPVERQAACASVSRAGDDRAAGAASAESIDRSLNRKKQTS